MNGRELVPWVWGDRERQPIRRSESPGPVVTLHHEMTLCWEKKPEKEGEGRSIRERFYGHCERSVSLDREVGEDSIRAAFHHGHLTATLSKSAKAPKTAKRTGISTGDITH